MVPKEMHDKLNEQLNKEAYSANLYLNMGAWCMKNALKGCGKFLIKHGYEELTHMQKIFDYICDTNGQAVMTKIEEAPHDFKDIYDIFIKVLEHERNVTNSIHELFENSQKIKDYASFSFLEWFVSEQIEEEILFEDIVDKMNLLGELKGHVLYLFDKEIGSIE